MVYLKSVCRYIVTNLNTVDIHTIEICTVRNIIQMFGKNIIQLIALTPHLNTLIRQLRQWFMQQVSQLLTL